MRKIASILAVAAITLFATSCGGGSNSPAGIEKSINSQIQRGNYGKAVEILFDKIDDDQNKKGDVRVFAAKTQNSIEAKGGLKHFEILKETISEDGASATVETKFVYGNGEEETDISKYVKKDGKWKIQSRR